ncbi:family 20 glycosylhydrolase [Flexithrix dorotheae]|uniref:family 20 glycosylhydrolase n=1 Tax=Flexithrix dorotheae TaxID=70993 RepID=UPI00036D0E5B|nr:family 20 glycosylhydrolase [Flexithrix dorotheae]
MRINTFLIFFISIPIFISCNSSETISPEIDVHWELVTNFTGEPDVFEAKFTLSHQGGFDLDQENWALFFNIAPRTIVPTPEPQPATVEHLNGDWYKLKPNTDFKLTEGESVEILYKGIEAVIKETDRPLGLYFVFYDDNGDEKEIKEVKNVSFTPFTKPEQINRNTNDFDPIPTAEYLYRSNQEVSQIPAEQLNAIIPSPVKKVEKNDNLSLTKDFVIVFGEGTENEAKFLKNKLKEDLGLDLALQEGGSASKKITLNIKELTVNDTKEEAYELNISLGKIDITGSDPAGVFYGIQSLRALIPIEAFQNQGAPVLIKCQEISDAPRFAFRSLHLDVGRNFQTKETIMRLLDAMAFYKLNHFLFYLTEDEGWRLEIEGLPELTEIGAVRKHTSSYKNSVLHPGYGSGPFADDPDKHGHGYYTRQDFIEIIKYAKERHIQVIPEVNFPGHARAAIKAMDYRYERLMKEGKPEEAKEFLLSDPDDTSSFLSAQCYKDNVVCVVQESAYHFYEKVVEDIISMYQEAGIPMPIFHMGGDEVPEGAWTGSPLVAEFMKQHPEIKNHHELHAYFIKTMTERLADKELEWHGWEEVALKKLPEGGYEPNPEFVDKNVVPYIWNNLFDYPDIGYKLANAGYPVVLCNVSNFYFDLAYNKDPKEPGLYWAGFINEKDNWTFSPYNMFRTTLNTAMGQDIRVLRTETKGDKKVDIAEIKPGDNSTYEWERLKPEAYKNILGIEAQIWSETIKGRDMLEYYYLPKLMGFAESAWTDERTWENENDEVRRNALQQKEWNVFVNLLAQKELPRLSYLNNGYNYRIPTPGAVIEDGILKANVEYPGLKIHYSLDGSEPNEKSQLYQQPIKVEVGSRVKLVAVDHSGRSSRSIEVN